MPTKKRKRFDNLAMPSALVATAVALATAGGRIYLDRAGTVLRAITNDRRVSPGTAAILQDILTAVEHVETT